MTRLPPPTRPSPARLQSLFDGALEQPAAGRAAWLERACAGDRALLRELLELVAAADDAPPFLERSAQEVELAGHRAGPWRIESLLTSGGMGDVHVASRADAELPWRVAVKVLKRGLDGDDFVRRFHAERRTLAALAHPHIVALIDAGTLADGRPWFATELIDGVPIDRHCGERALPLDARLRLLLAVCGAVAHAHQRFVVHCDLKPANVLVTSDGLPKLLDFGIARLIAPSAPPDEDAGARPWTAGYASPELQQGCAIGCASDVFSLGVLIRAVCAGARDRRRAEIEAIARLATATAPADRYASVEALAADLRACLEGRPLLAEGGGALHRLGKFVRRNRVATAAAVVALVSLSWGAFEAWQRMVRSRAAAREEARLGWGAHAQALRVTSFLQQLVLDASSADRAALAAAVDRAAARLEAGPRPAAEAEGRMRIALGALYLELARPADARPQLDRALALASSQRGFGREDVDHVRRLLAQAEEMEYRAPTSRESR